MTLPLMPKATAVWLIEKTALTFTQIADFCGMHPLEVQAIADGEVAQGIVGYDPVANGQVTAGRDPPLRGGSRSAAEAARPPRCRCRSGCAARATRRWPSATTGRTRIAFLLRNYPQLTEAQVAKLLGTTKETIQKVRERSHWNSANIKPRDPVILGLCSQTDLNAAIASGQRAAGARGPHAAAAADRGREPPDRAWRRGRMTEVGQAGLAGKPGWQIRQWSWARSRSISSLTRNFSIFSRVRRRCPAAVAGPRRRCAVRVWHGVPSGLRGGTAGSCGLLHALLPVVPASAPAALTAAGDRNPSDMWRANGIASRTIRLTAVLC